MENEKALVTVSGGALMESEVITEALAFAQKGFGGMPVTLPKGYDISRAVKNLCFALPNVVNISKATKQSIMQAMHDYLTQGLDVGKHQCALIVYLDKDDNGKYTGTGRLTVQREYFGNVNQALRLNPNIEEISHGTAIHEGESVAMEYDKYGHLTVKHIPKFDCLSKPVVGAYVVVTFKDGHIDTELMDIVEIRKSWAMSRNGDKVHKDFPAEMAKKTVLNRLCKKLVNSTDDSAIINDIDERQSIEASISIDEIEEYSEPQEIESSLSDNKTELQTVAAPLTEEPPAPIGDPDAEDYCIKVHYATYASDYSDCKTGNYTKATKMIDVYPNQKKKPKKAAVTEEQAE